MKDQKAKPQILSENEGIHYRRNKANGFLDWRCLQVQKISHFKQTDY